VRANHVLVKNYAVLGLHWGAYNLHDPAAIRDAQRAIYALYEAKAFRPLVSEKLPMSAAPAAMAKVASRGSTGKIVLIPA
jgi:NADPH2:quinone reductase